MFKERYKVVYYSKLLYQLVLFVSFCCTVLVFPFIKVFIGNWLGPGLLLFVAPLVIAYLVAMHVLPELLSMIITSFFVNHPALKGGA